MGHPNMVTGLDHPEVVRVNLEKAIASSPFATADRLRRFLRYIVEKSLAGEVDVLKEYPIGVEVYGRKPDFDPRVDAIVRVEASRLRRKLREYYEAAGRDDPIRIELPKGTYLPLFIQPAESLESLPKSAAPERRRSAAAWVAIAACAAGMLFWGWTAYRGKPRPPESAASVAVLPFVISTLATADESFADSLTQAITASLASAPGLRVAPPGAVLRFRGRPEAASAIGRQLGARTVLAGSVRNAGDRIRITAQLVSSADGTTLWSETFERGLLDSPEIRTEVSRLIARAVREKLLEK
jgi:adenylate cyclase